MRLISSFCALLCASAVPLAAVAQTAAETPAPETAPDTAGRTVLDVTVSGTLTGLAADALGPDAALTVRLHGPVAFDVDTADFASLEIFADDPAVKLTVSDTAASARITAVSLPKAYDRITAVSIPKAYGASAAATFTAAAASAGIATLAEGDTATAVTPQNRVISINFEHGITNTHPVVSGDSVGLVPVPSAAWFNAVQNKDSLSTGREETVNTYWNGTEKDTSLTGVTLWCKAATCWEYTDGVTDAFLKGYLDDGKTNEGYGAQINLSTIPFEMYDVYVYCATDTASQKFRPITIEYEDGSSIVYTANGAHPYGKAVAGNSDFGMTQQKTAILNTNTLLLRGLTEKTLKVRGGVGSGSTPRGGIAAIQVVESRSVPVKGEQTLSGTLAGSSSTTHAMFLLEADSALKVDSKNFNRLWIIGPETGTATLQIAADVDFSKIDLSEATNVNIEFVAPQEGGNTPLAVTGSLQASGDVTISTPVTLTVDSADVTPYWSVGGSLTIAEGSSLTLALPADTDVTAPAVLLSAASVVGQAGLQGPEGARLLNLGGTALVLAADDVLCAVASGETAWTDLTWTRADGTEAEIAGDSAVLLTLENGSSLDIAGAQTVASLNLAGASAAVAATLSGDGLSVSEALRVIRGNVTLPAGLAFDQTTSGDSDADDEPGDNPAFEIAEGASVTLSGSGKYIRKESVVGGGTLIKPIGIDRIGFYGAGQHSLDGITLRLLGGGVKFSLGTADPSMNNATVIFGDGTAGTDATLCQYGWLRLSGEVTFDAQSAMSHTTNSNARVAPISGTATRLTLTGPSAKRIALGESLAVTLRQGETTVTLAGNGNAVTVEPDAVAKIDGPGFAASGIFTGTGAVELTGTGTVQVNALADSFGGTLRVTEGVTTSGDWAIPCNVELNGTAGSLTVGNGYTLSGTGTVTGTLTFENGATLDASAGALTVGGLTQPDTGTVTVTVAENAAVEDAVLRLSSGTADALAAAQFTVAERDTLRVAASGSDYVLALRMPTNGEASVTVTKPADGSSVNWSGLQWTVGSDTYPSAAAGTTNALTLALPEGVTVAVDETITAKSLTVTVVDGNGDGQVTDPATLLLRDDEDLADIAETLTVTALAVLQVPCTGTAQQIETMNLAKVRGSGVLEISGTAGATCSALGLSTEAGKTFNGTLRIAEGVTKSGDWTIPCNVELNGTVSGALTVSTGKRFGGSGTVTGQLDLASGYILKCGASADQVPLIEGGLLIHFGTTVSGGRLWRDTAKEDFILRLAKRYDNDPAFIANSSGYVVDEFKEGAVSGLRLAAAFELNLSDLRDPGKTSGTYAWDVANNWLPPAGKSGFPGDANNKDDVVRIMVPASRNVTVVIPPDASVAVRAIQVIGMTGEAEGWTTGTLRWVEGTFTKETETVIPSATLSSTLTTQEIRMAGPMEITQECNVSVKSAAGWRYEARIGSGAAASTVHVRAGKFEADSLIMDNTTFTVGGEENTAASVICDFLYLQTQSGGSGSLTVGQGGSFTPSYISDISPQDSLELAGGTFTVPASGMKLSDQIVVSADSTLHFAGTDPTEAILSFVADAQGVGFSGSGTLTLTGTGTLNASNATEDSAYTGRLQFPEGNQVVCNIGQRRPTIGGAPYRIEVVRKTEEADEVRIPLNNVDTFVMPPLSDANATAGVAVSGWVGTVAKIDRSKTPADLVLTPLGYPQLEGGAVPGISGEAAMVLRELANSGNRNFTVRQTTVTGTPVEFDAEKVNAALLLFTNVAKKETDGSVTVAYAFGISDITVEGDNIIVTAKVLGPEGAAMAADFAGTASVVLYRNDVQSTAVPSDGTEAGTQVLKLEGALSTLKADSAATFTVKAEDKSATVSAE